MSNTIRTQRDVLSIEPCIQQTVLDCAVACVAMLTGHSYADVFQGSTTVAKRARAKGAGIAELKRLAKGVGARLRLKRGGPDLDEDTGILWLNPTGAGVGHMVLLFRGVLIDPSNGQLWTPDAYLTENPCYTVGRLLELC